MHLRQIHTFAREGKSTFIGVFIRRCLFLLKGKNIITGSNVIFEHLENIQTKDLVKIGIDYNGFVYKNDITYLNIRGKLNFKGRYSIGKGCRFDIGPYAVVEIGNGGYVNAFTKFVISHKLTIGDDCAISWNCQFLDDDFHTIDYEGRKKLFVNDIVIGNNVYIGSNTSIYKGVKIPDGCIIASDSVVKTSFSEQNVLIGGNPAIILKRNVTWI
jgi:acetyltransferase-like isoleucine patch superfamily enzyme